jgi:hypothetical protein
MPSQARSAIAKYFNWYNRGRSYSKLERLTPDETYGFFMPTLAQVA